VLKKLELQTWSIVLALCVFIEPGRETQQGTACRWLADGLGDL